MSTGEFAHIQIMILLGMGFPTRRDPMGTHVTPLPAIFAACFLLGVVIGVCTMSMYYDSRQVSSAVMRAIEAPLAVAGRLIPTPPAPAPARSMHDASASVFGTPDSDTLPRCTVGKTFGDQSITVQFDCDSAYAYWWRGSFPRWEMETSLFLVNLTERCLVSFGEWIGPIVIPLKLLKPDLDVYVFEPDPWAFNELSNNLALNNVQVSLYLQAVGVANEFITMRGTGDSVSSIKMIDGYQRATKWRSRVVSFERLLKQFPECAFKIDVEGYEETLLKILVENPPSSFSLSTHWNFLDNRTVFQDTVDRLYRTVDCQPSAKAEELYCHRRPYSR